MHMILMNTLQLNRGFSNTLLKYANASKKAHNNMTRETGTNLIM